MTKTQSVAIGVLFYVGWFGCVYLANTPYSLFSFFFPLILMAFLSFNRLLHLKNVLLALVISAFGIAFDSLAIKMSWIAVPNPEFFLLPVWLVAIWLLFSFSMVKLGLILNPPLWLAVLLGFIMGPLSYKSGEMFGTLSLTSQASFLIYGLFWSAFFPIVLKSAKRFS